jgi:putative transposase
MGSSDGCFHAISMPDLLHFGKLTIPNSHQPTRLREKKMRRFKSTKQAQRFLSAFGLIAGHFQPRRHRLRAGENRAILQDRFQIWNEVTGGKQVA